MGGSLSAPKQVQILKTGNAAQQEKAAKALGDIARDYPDRREYVVAAGSLPLLVDLVKKGSPRLQEVAAGALSHIAMNQANKAKIAEAGAIPVLIKFLKTAGVEGKGAAAAAIANLAGGCLPNQVAIAKQGGIPPLVELTQCSMPRVKAWAAVALGNVGLQCKESQEAVGKAGGVDALLRLLAEEPERGSEASAPAPSLQQQLRAACGRRQDAASAAALHADEPRLKELTVKAVSSLAFDHAENQRRIVESDGLRLLVGILTGGGEAARVEAVKALCNILVHGVEAKNKFVEVGGIQALVGTAEDSKVRDLAAALLGSIGGSGSDEAGERMLEVGAIDFLVGLLGSGSDQGKQWAAAALRTLAEKHVKSKARIADAGGIRALAKLTGSTVGPKVAVGASRALHALAQGNEEIERQIREAGGGAALDQVSKLGGMSMRSLGPEEAAKASESAALVKVEEEKEEDS